MLYVYVLYLRRYDSDGRPDKGENGCVANINKIYENTPRKTCLISVRHISLDPLFKGHIYNISYVDKSFLQNNTSVSLFHTHIIVIGKRSFDSVCRVQDDCFVCVCVRIRIGWSQILPRFVSQSLNTRGIVSYKGFASD